MKENIYPYILQPVSKSYRWGGVKLSKMFGKQVVGDNLAESWEISCHNDGLSTIANGSLAGKTLREAVMENPQIVSPTFDGAQDFPLLVKFIDANDNLSVQVHPNDEYAVKVGSLGKTECWYIVSAEYDGGIYLGLNAQLDKEQLQQALTDGTILSKLNFINAQQGQLFYIPSGLIHAIGKGVVVYELQQSSNITYRLYDYNWKDANGAARQLHIDDALNVANLNKYYPINYAPDGDGVKLSCKYFKLSKYTKSTKVVSLTSCCLVTIIEGQYTYSVGDKAISLDEGASLFVPCAMEVSLHGNGVVLVATLD